MAGKQRIKTRAARRKIIPSIVPGVLNGDGEARHEYDRGSALARHFAGKIQQLCEFNRERPMPPFRRDTRKLDTWLQGAIDDDRTNFLSAFVDQASMIQANRPYRLTGSKSVVARTLNMLHASEGGEGFRKLLKLVSLSYYMSNFGGAVYLNRVEPVQATYLPHLQAWDWQLPAVSQMFATDPTLFTPRDDYVYPVEYDGTPWTRYDYFKITSMPSTLTSTWGVGRCALFRCIQIAKMTSAIYNHIYDIVSPDTAKGIVTIQGMDWDEFIQAMTGSEAVNEQDITKTNGFLPGDDLGDLLVLASREDKLEVRFTTLGRIPEGFFLDQWVRWTLTSFATNLGFPLEEFIGMPANRLLGQSAQEIESGERRGGSKGGAEFINQFEENLKQTVIPTTVEFVFAERDSITELNEIAIKEKNADIITQLFEAVQLVELDESVESETGGNRREIEREAKRQSQRIINAAEARRLCVELGVLPDWIRWNKEEVNDVESVPIDSSEAKLRLWREQAMESPAIRKLAAKPLGEPVVRYENIIDRETGYITEREITLWDDDNEMGRPTAWAGYQPMQEGFRTTSMAQDWGVSRNTRKRPKLETALKSDHTDALVRVIRGYLADQNISGLDRETRESITSRLYAVTQIGRDSVLGRNRPQEKLLAEIAGEMVGWATGYTQAFAHTDQDGEHTEQTEDRVPTGTSAPQLQQVRTSFVQGVEVWAEDVAAALPEAARERARDIAEDLVCRAYAAGQYATALKVDVRRKAWVSNDTVHGSLDGMEIGLSEDFVEGLFWAGMKPGCRCEIRVKV